MKTRTSTPGRRVATADQTSSLELLGLAFLAKNLKQELKYRHTRTCMKIFFHQTSVGGGAGALISLVPQETELMLHRENIMRMRYMLGTNRK